MSVVLKIIGWALAVVGGLMVLTQSLASHNDVVLQDRLIGTGLQGVVAGVLILAVAKVIDLLDDIARSLRAHGQPPTRK